MGKNLVYTLALDPAGATGHRNLAKMLVSSLLRTRFSGDILVFHNSPAPLFMVARHGVREVRMKVPATAGKNGGFVAYAQSCKHAVAAHIDAAAYDRVMFIDCDSVVLRNIDHLLAGHWELAVFPEQNSDIHEYCWGGYLTRHEQKHLVHEGLNSGTWAVKGARFHELLRRWRAVEKRKMTRDALREQSAFNRVALDWDGPVNFWPQREIALPLVTANLVCYHDYAQTAIVHAASGMPVDYKSRFLFGIFAGAFLFDTQLLLLNTLEM